MSWYVYLLECADGTLYTGITRDPAEREAAHNRGVGAAYTRARLPVRLAFVEPAAHRPAALRRELQLKAWPRRRKLELLATRECVRRDAPLLSTAGFAAPHGFSSRDGGVSDGSYRSLNLGANTADRPERVERNREIFADWFGVDSKRVSLLDQVHGERVVPAGADGSPAADAQISDDPSLLLAIGSADCLPLLFHDRRTGAVGAAHCGWRGTASGLAAKTVSAMQEEFGSRARDIVVAIGPGICRTCYQVGPEVVERFLAAGLPARLATPDGERWLLDLAAANVHVLERAGVSRRSILLQSQACTSCDPDRFFSHRRDSGVTGRHWGAVRATRPMDG
ncbi:MAG: peptidoglycan editing factor PgeF [Trueperaceae bacterium]